MPLASQIDFRNTALRIHGGIAKYLAVSLNAISALITDVPYFVTIFDTILSNRPKTYNTTRRVAVSWTLSYPLV